MVNFVEELSKESRSMTVPCECLTKASAVEKLVDVNYPLILYPIFT